MLIWPDSSKAQNNIAAVSADGRTVCVLIRRLNSSWRRSMALVVLALRHCDGGKSGEGEQGVSGFLEAVGDRAVPKPH